MSIFIFLRVLLQTLFGRRPARKTVLKFSVGAPEPKRKPKPMIVKLTNEQKVTVTLNPQTDGGKPAKLDGKPEWSVVSGDATLNVAEDGLSAEIVSPDVPGQSQVLVQADADLGEGVETISGTLDVQVAGAAAKNLGLSLGIPVLK